MMRLRASAAAAAGIATWRVALAGGWRALAMLVWGLALLGATLGLFVGRTVFERGITYGNPGPALPDLDGPQRAINTYLELEADAEGQRRALQMIRAAGFGWIRQQFAWADLEVGAKGQFYDYTRERPTWDAYDQMVTLAHAEGLRVIARLDLPPEWARPPGSYKTHPPRNVQDYGDFVAAFVDHYRGRIMYVQLWNEPNLNEEWGRRTVDAAGYVELLKAGYRGAKQADPAVRVLSGELAQTLEPDAASANGLNDILYLERMYDHGAQPYFDVLAANAYGLWTGPEDRQFGQHYTNFPRVLLTRETMVRRGDAGKAVWVTEFGWNALPPHWAGQPSPWGYVSPAQQGSYIIGAYTRARREWPWMGPMALWLFRQPRADPRDPTPYFGIVDAEWHRRPAYDALRDTATEPVLGPGVHQETSVGLSFVGLWQRTRDGTASLGAFQESPVSGTTVRLRFHGEKIDLLAPVGPSRGIAYVKIDGAYTLANRAPVNRNGQATIDFYAPAAATQRRILIADGLPDGEHQLELIVTGEHSAQATGAGVGIDAVIVSRSRPLLPLFILSMAWTGTALAVVWTARDAVRRQVARGQMGTKGAAASARASRLIALEPSTMPPVTVPAWARLPATARSVPWQKAGVLAAAASLSFTPLALHTPAGRLTPVELFILLGGVGAAAKLFLHDRHRPWRPAFAGPAVVLLVAGTISLFVAEYPRLAFRELRTLVLQPVLFYALARWALHGPRDGRLLATAFLAGATAVAALALLQTVFGWGLVAAEGVARAGALYQSPNNLALLLDRAVPLALALALYGKPHASRLTYLAGAATLLCAAALFFTFSRGAWLATALATAVVVAPRLAHRRQAVRPGVVAVLAAGAIPLLVAAAALALRFERFRSLPNAEGTGFLRIHLWGAALRMAQDHPLWGVGLDQFLYHYPRYMFPAAWREPNLSHPHNILLDLWLRLGILGLLSLGWSVWILVRHLRLGRREQPAIVLGVAGSALASFLHGLVDNSYFVVELAYAFWLLLLLAELASDERVRHGAK